MHTHTPRQQDVVESSYNPTQHTRLAVSNLSKHACRLTAGQCRAAGVTIRTQSKPWSRCCQQHSPTSKSCCLLSPASVTVTSAAHSGPPLPEARGAVRVMDQVMLRAAAGSDSTTSSAERAGGLKRHKWSESCIHAYTHVLHKQKGDGASTPRSCFTCTHTHPFFYTLHVY